MADANALGDQDVAYTVMDTLVDKLQALGYETTFLSANPGFVPLNRTYFAVAQGSNAGEQFHYFTTIAAWLMEANSHFFPPPQEFDDPNFVASNIVTELGRLGITVDCAPAKLIQGWGRNVVEILDALADKTLATRGFEFSSTPHIPADDYEDEVEAEETMEAVADDIIDDIDTDSDDDGGFLVGSALAGAGPLVGGAQAVASVARGDGGADVDLDEWRLEVERVEPQLRVTLAADHKDWRSHYDQMKDHQKGIGEAMAGAQSSLTHLSGDIEKTLSKITSREKYVNAQFSDLVAEYQAARAELLEATELYDSSSTNINALQRELGEITDQLDDIKARMDDRGSSAMDASPVARVKRAVTTLKDDIKILDVRIGVAEHALSQARKSAKEAAKAGASGSL